VTDRIIENLRSAPPIQLPGWGRVPEYSNWMDEQMSWKETCYVGDWSFLATFEVEGPDALNLFSDISVNSFTKFEIGQAKHVIQCNVDGKVITEGILIRLAEDRFWIQSVPAFYAAYHLSTGKYNATGRYVDMFFYQVQGPNALAVLESLAGDQFRDVGFMRSRKIVIDGHEVLALRQGMSGEIGGFELQGLQDEHAPHLLDAILKAGEPFGIRRLGMRSAMINHLEAWYPTVVQHYLPAMFGADTEGYREYLRSDKPIEQGCPVARVAYLRRMAFNLSGSFEGADVSDYYRSPVELNWAKNIKFDHDFIGRRALEAEVADPKRVGVTLEFDSSDIADLYASLFEGGSPYTFMDIPHHQQSSAHASEIRISGKLVGLATYPGYSFFFRKVLAISCIDVEHSKPGTQVEVLWGNPGMRQKLLRATVASSPYKRDHRRASLV
jgi:vanillate/3-O-methylgallate O-demethylase